MWLIISSLHVIACLLLICLVLLQQGKGADMGASFGGDSSSLFGPMVENPLKNLTTIVAIVFMSTAVGLAYKSRFSTDAAEGRLFSRQAAQESSEGAKNPTPPPATENNVQEPVTPPNAVEVSK